MSYNLRLVGGDDDAVVHAPAEPVLWLASACGLRMSVEERQRLRLVPTDDPVDCMTCLVITAGRRT